MIYHVTQNQYPLKKTCLLADNQKTSTGNDSIVKSMSMSQGTVTGEVCKITTMTGVGDRG